MPVSTRLPVADRRFRRGDQGPIAGPGRRRFHGVKSRREWHKICIPRGDLSNDQRGSDRVFMRPFTDILVKVERGDGEVHGAVTNRGEGILPEDLPKLFTRFYRTRVAKERRVVGLGLGLYMTKGLVEAHGGRIWVESIPGQTTTFYFSLPIPGRGSP